MVPASATPHRTAPETLILHNWRHLEVQKQLMLLSSPLQDGIAADCVGVKQRDEAGTADHRNLPRCFTMHQRPPFRRMNLICMHTRRRDGRLVVTLVSRRLCPVVGEATPKHLGDTPATWVLRRREDKSTTRCDSVGLNDGWVRKRASVQARR